MKPAVTVEIETVNGPVRRCFVGRVAWALMALFEAGQRGVTAIEVPGPRWSSYVHRLRRAGVEIETIDERHGGDFAGSHARYFVRSRLRIVADPEAVAA